MEANKQPGDRLRQDENTFPACICDAVSWEEILGRNGFQTLSPFSAVAVGAANGCHLCSLFFGSLKTFDPPNGDTRLTSNCPCISDTNVQLDLVAKGHLVFVLVNCSLLSGSNHMAVLQLSTMPHNLGLDFGNELRNIENRRRGGPEMVGLELEDLLQAWIADCEKSHRFCSRMRDHTLPSRLLDVRGGSSREDLRLAVPPPGSKGSWVALSYCWGGVGGSYQTTTQNIDDYKSQISLESLPRTIRDAITITRGLGVRYLWVDALCIVQDSRDDWRAEAPKMMNVYRNACLTIAANIGGSADAGLGIDRNILETRAYELPFTEEGGAKLTKFRWMHPPRLTWESVIGSATLQTRGWTMQETHMAPRVIYFDKEGLYWQCREGIRQERMPASLITANDLAVTRRRIFDGVSEDPVNIFVLWQDLVKDFTSRKLTYQSDKLFAVAGIAAATAVYIKSRLRRRLATPEEEQTYLSPKLPKHWAVPDNPLAVGWMRHDGANAALRFILSTTHKSAERYMGGPVSMDPWLGLRFTVAMDPRAEREFYELGPEVREMMISVGMENLLKFVDDTENPDYDHEYVVLMSHPDTHAAYIRAYGIWEKKNGTSNANIHEEDYDHNSPPARDAQELDHQQDITTAPEQWSPAEVCEEGIEDPEALEREERMDTSLPLHARKAFAATRGGVYIDPNMETEVINQMGAVYVYSDDNLVKARVEWPGFVSDDTYLAGIWKADIINQLQWCVTVPGTRPWAYRAPSWSWASMDDAEINCESHELTRSEGYNYTRLPRLLDVRVVVEGEDWYGDAKSGKLILLADIAEVEIVDSTDESEMSLWTEDHGSASGGEEATQQSPRGALPREPLLTLDELDYHPGSVLKMVRLSDTFCLAVEVVKASRDILVGKRVGCWTGDRGLFEDLEGAMGSLSWQTKIVDLI